MRSRTFFRCVFGIIIVAPVVGGCDGANSIPEPPPKQWILEPPASAAAESGDDDVKQGPALYRHYCGVCHGPEGKGDGQYYSDSLDAKPADLTDRQTVGQLSGEYISKVIREGSASVGKSPLCPPWGRVFSGEQVTAVVAHVRGLSAAPAEE